MCVCVCGRVHSFHARVLHSIDETATGLTCTCIVQYDVCVTCHVVKVHVQTVHVQTQSKKLGQKEQVLRARDENLKFNKTGRSRFDFVGVQCVVSFHITITTNISIS